MKFLDNDFWKEILQTIMQQKSRSIMTAFGVFWGIFMLVMLVGMGVGMDNGIIASYTCVPQNSLFILSRPTTKPYHGLEQGRFWHMENSDLDAIRKAFPKAFSNIVGISYANNNVPLLIKSADRSAQYVVCGINPEMINALPHKVLEGRYINDTDISEQRYVCVIGENVSKILFGDKSPLGKTITIDDKVFTVVGVTAKTNNRVNVGPNIPNSVLLPLPVMQLTFNIQQEIDTSIFVMNTGYSIGIYQPKIASMIKERHNIHPQDTEAVYEFNFATYVKKYYSLLTGIDLLIWIVGIGTLLAGLIGISNIMVVTVSERTKEIGIRRALGAMPESITMQILSESLMLTFVAGFAGLACGIYLLALISNILPPSSENSVIANPYMPMIPAITAFIIIILGGLLAGWIPVRRALAIKPIEALREE